MSPSSPSCGTLYGFLNAVVVVAVVAVVRITYTASLTDPLSPSSPLSPSCGSLCGFFDGSAVVVVVVVRIAARLP